MTPSKLLKRLRVDDPDHFRLAAFDPADTGGLDKDAAEAMLADDVKRLADLQQCLYSDGRWALLVVLQGMDAAGKDGVIKHVMTGLNPQGCSVHAFKAPSEEELEHDFLWRAAVRLPERRRIGIFNRSHYEETLVVRVHPEMLQRQHLPPKLVGENIWQERFQDIRKFERHIARNGVAVLKFFLHVSREEQRQRLLERLEQPAKRWKFSKNDIAASFFSEPDLLPLIVSDPIQVHHRALVRLGRQHCIYVLHRHRLRSQPRPRSSPHRRQVRRRVRRHHPVLRLHLPRSHLVHHGVVHPRRRRPRIRRQRDAKRPVRSQLRASRSRRDRRPARGHE